MKITALFLPLLVVVLTLTACNSAVTPARLSKIIKGMTPAEVVTQLGQPVRIDHAEITGLAGDAYHYVSSQGDAQVVLINGTVFGTQFVPGGKGS